MWPQDYHPLHSILLSSLIAAIPVVVLLGLSAFAAFWGRKRARLSTLRNLPAIFRSWPKRRKQICPKDRTEAIGY